jgi:hypothetical protein
MTDLTKPVPHSEPTHTGVNQVVNDILIIIFVNQNAPCTRQQIRDWLTQLGVEKPAGKVSNAISSLVDRKWLRCTGGRDPSAVFHLGRRARRFIRAGN